MLHKSQTRGTLKIESPGASLLGSNPGPAIYQLRNIGQINTC